MHVGPSSEILHSIVNSLLFFSAVVVRLILCRFFLLDSTNFVSWSHTQRHRAHSKCMPSDAYANKIYICLHCIELRRNECDAFQWLPWLVECVVMRPVNLMENEEKRPPDAIYHTMIRRFLVFFGFFFRWNLPGVKLRSVHSCIGCWRFG